MNIFLDSANLDEIREIKSTGILHGITTNPTLLSRIQVDHLADFYLEICKLADVDVSAEVHANDFEGMVNEGRNLARIHPHIVVKIPMSWEGLKAIQTLHQESIRTNCTLIFSPVQALLAAQSGASFVSPFLGRLDDIGHNGIQLIEQIRTIFINYGIESKILAASIRSTQHVLQCALSGADIATLPYGILKNLLKHPLTDIGLEKFNQDAQKVRSSLKS